MGDPVVLRHVWDWHMPQEEQAKCWCLPFCPPVGVPFIGGLVFHRGSPGCVFHEYGEQGPVGADCDCDQQVLRG